MNSANDKYGTSLDRPYGAGKLPVDPASRLSELLAQSLEELTQPFDQSKPSPRAVEAVVPQAFAPASLGAAATPASALAGASTVTPMSRPQAVPDPVTAEPEPQHSDQGRIDADKALAELEAELFAAAKQVDRDNAAAQAAEDTTREAAAPDEEHSATSTSDLPDAHFDQLERALMEPLVLAANEKGEAKQNADAADISPRVALADSLTEPRADADATALVARVRRLMLISMAVTVLAVGSVFGFIGYRVMKGDAATAKTADKLPPASAIPTDVTFSIPRGAKVIHSAVANDRLVMTLEIDGKVEVRTFDVKTLQPAGRLNFSATP
jgi:hypothetical protein